MIESYKLLSISELSTSDVQRDVGVEFSGMVKRMF